MNWWSKGLRFAEDAIGTKVAPNAAKLWGAAKMGVSSFDKGGPMKGLIGAVAPIIILPGSPEEKIQNLKVQTALWYLTSGMKNPVRQGVWSVLAMAAPHSGELLRGLVTSYRDVQPSRTSAAIPFAHSTVSMDHCMLTFQYAQIRMNTAYAWLGGK